MKPQWPKVVFVVSCICALGCEEGDVKSYAPNLVIQGVANSQISRMEIVNLPIRIRTRTRVTEAALDRDFTYKFCVQRPANTPQWAALRSALLNTRTRNEVGLADLRWGIVFYGMDNRRIGTVYFDGTGRHGAVGTQPVAFKGSVFAWLLSNCEPAMR